MKDHDRGKADFGNLFEALNRTNEDARTPLRDKHPRDDDWAPNSRKMPPYPSDDEIKLISELWRASRTAVPGKNRYERQKWTAAQVAKRLGYSDTGAYKWVERVLAGVEGYVLHGKTFESKVNEQNGYIAMWNGKREEIYADSLYAAKLKAIEKMKIPKSKQGLLSVTLAEKDGEDVVHTPSD